MSKVSSVLNEQNSFLVIVDIQERLLSAVPKAIGASIVNKVGVLLKSAQKMNVPMIVTEQYPKGLGATSEVLKNQLSSSDKIIEKTCFSCTQADGFMSILRSSQRRQIILVGMETHICILQTAFALQAQGFQVFVVEDAVCSRTQQNQDNAKLRLQQEGVVITNTESVLFEWLTDAKHPEFKALSKLIV